MQIFISYNREDQNFAEHLRDRLIAWGYKAWIDTDNILPGEGYWPGTVTEGLRTSNVVNGIMSRESLKSKHVMLEWLWTTENNKPLILLKIDDVMPSDIDYIYIGRQYIDFTTDEEAGFEKLKVALERPESAGSLGVRKAKQILKEINHRSRMLQRVQNFWIKGVLEKTLQSSTLIDLRMEYDREAVEHPWWGIFQQPDNCDQTLPTEAKLMAAFDEMDGALLILGAPGTGKTTAMLELARDLIARAEEDLSRSIPVVFNLSSWANEKKPLAEWLVDELEVRYYIPRKIGQNWVGDQKLLLLLDGLDEVTPNARDACVEMINAFKLDNKSLELVVCSRYDEYKALKTRLKLHGAIVLKELTDEQIADYFTNRESHLKEMVERDHVLRDLVRTPLMLNIITTAYDDLAPDQHVTDDTGIEDRRKYVLDKYRERMFKHRGKNEIYVPKSVSEQTDHYLAWLAQQMLEHSQTVFNIEAMQPSWLPSHRQQETHALIIQSFVFVILTVTFGFASGLGFGTLLGFYPGIIAGMVGGIAWGIMALVVLNHASRLIGGLLIGLGFGIAWGFAGWFAQGIRLALFNGLSSLVGIGLIYPIARSTILSFPTIANPNRVVLVEQFNWSWRKGLKWVGIMLLILMPMGFFYGLTFYAASDLDTGLFLAVLSWLLMAMTFGLSFGLTSGEIEQRVETNQGIKRSSRNALYVGLGTGLISILIYGVFANLHFKFLVSLSIGLAYCLAFGSIYWLIFGGYTVIQHIILRVMLTRNGSMPWKYADFLDFAVGRIFLYKVGGGYIFIHRIFQDYFARMETSDHKS